jgi:hypothetical protein
MRFLRRSFYLTLTVILGVAFCSSRSVRAADATNPAAPATGTIRGKVTGADGKPANGVTVRLVAGEPGKAKGGKKAKAAANAAAQPAPAQALVAKGAKAAKGAGKAGKKAASLKETTTNDQGEFTFTDVPVGSYAVYAGGKRIGNGHAPAEVTAGNSVNLSVTLKAGKGKADKVGGGKAPRPEPAAQDPAAPAK